MSFGLSLDDYFDVIRDDYNGFIADKMSRKHALHCVLMINHLPEQVWRIYGGVDAEKCDMATNMPSYKEILEEKHNGLRIIRHLANGTKHWEIRTNTPVVQDGTFVDESEIVLALIGLPSEKNPMTLLDEDLGMIHALAGEPCLEVIVADGSKLRLETLLTDAFVFWEAKFKDLKLLG